jgi:thioredoxin
LLGSASDVSWDFYFADLELCLVMATDNSTTIKLDESNFDREINGEKPVLVDFWAEWCGPCKLIAPLLEEIAREKADAVKVAKVNVDENQSLSFKYNIRAIPSLLFFKNGQLRDQVTGMTSKKDLISRLEALV